MFDTAIAPVIAAITAAGGHALIVGGAVRDMVLGAQPKDVDIEVYRLSVADLSTVLTQFGDVRAVGISFGVLKLQHVGREYDISLPRRERKAGSGHRGFVIEADPTMTPREAAARRDFTCNALAYDPLTGEILDFFGGRADLAARRLRHVGPAFAEDPLRVLRGMQFAARLALTIDGETAALCRSLFSEYPTLARERIWAEWSKWANQGVAPAAGLRVLDATGWLAHYPALVALQGCLQNQLYHPEGDVWTHTGHVTDAAAHIATRDGLVDDDRIVLVLAALCHDLGKPLTTVERADGRIAAPGHAAAGIAPTQQLLDQIGCPPELSARVVALVREHMLHISIRGDVSATLVRRLADRLGQAGEQITMLARLTEADNSGRPPQAGGMPASMSAIVRAAEHLRVTSAAPVPILLGRHLREIGYSPGPQLGVILRAAREAQLDGAFDHVDGALAWVGVAFPKG